MPRWKPSNVPIATARGCRSSWDGEWTIFTAPPPRTTLPDDAPPVACALPIGVGLAPPLLLRLGHRQADPPQGVIEGDDPLGIRLVDGERPDFRSPQGDAVPAERIGDRPDVGAGADAQVEGGDAVCIRDDVERGDVRPPQGHLDGDALAMEPVGALTPDLDGRGRRDRKLDIAAEALERGVECLARDGRLVGLERLALGVAGRRPPREVDVREVALGEADEA